MLSEKVNVLLYMDYSIYLVSEIINRVKISIIFMTSVVFKTLPQWGGGRYWSNFSKKKKKNLDI